MFSAIPRKKPRIFNTYFDSVSFFSIIDLQSCFRVFVDHEKIELEEKVLKSERKILKSNENVEQLNRRLSYKAF